MLSSFHHAPRCGNLGVRAETSRPVSLQHNGDLRQFQHRERLHRVHAQVDEYFDEGAAQVKRLLDRDRKELMRDRDEQKTEYDIEYERPNKSNQESRNGSQNASTSGSSAFDDELSSLKNPMKKAFKSPPKKGAFGSSAKSPFGSDSGSATMQKDMWANMEPVEEDEAPWWTQISFGQVAIVFSFLTIIGLMLATTWATVKLGGVHFNE